jgi:hypothetical protein
LPATCFPLLYLTLQGHNRTSQENGTNRCGISSCTRGFTSDAAALHGFKVSGDIGLKFLYEELGDSPHGIIPGFHNTRGQAAQRGCTPDDDAANLSIGGHPPVKDP